MPVMPAITADVADSTATSNTAITNLNFPVVAARRYWFRAFIPYTAAATTTGAEFGVDTPATPTWLGFTTTNTISDAVVTSAAIGVDFDGTDDGSAVFPDSATATATEVNIAIVEGYVVPSASGAVQFQMDTEVGASAITVKAGAFVEYRDLSA